MKHIERLKSKLGKENIKGDDNKIKKMYAEGLTTEQIAAKYRKGKVK